VDYAVVLGFQDYESIELLCFKMRPNIFCAILLLLCSYDVVHDGIARFCWADETAAVPCLLRPPDCSLLIVIRSAGPSHIVFPSLIN